MCVALEEYGRSDYDDVEGTLLNIIVIIMLKQVI